MHIETISTVAYSKEENAIVERANKEVLRHLRALIFELGKRNDWIKFLPLVRRIMVSTVHDSIGVAPADLLYGGMINSNEGIFITSDQTLSGIINFLTEHQICFRLRNAF